MQGISCLPLKEGYQAKQGGTAKQHRFRPWGCEKRCFFIIRRDCYGYRWFWNLLT